MNTIRKIATGSRAKVGSAAAMLLVFVTQSWAGSYNFTNSSPITINDTGTPPTLADLYPSSITISGLDNSETITHLTVTLYGFSHTYPSDLDIVLAGPGGQLSMLMSQVGGVTKLPVSNLTLTLDDSALNSLPLDSVLTSGTFKPTRATPTLPFEFPNPAPAGSANAPATLSQFNGTNPNGTWSLYVLDDSSPDSGSIPFGWSMEVQTIPEPGSVGLALVGLGCLAVLQRRKN
jgi:subtilisin-like proprotein convertase family protein